MLMIEKAGWHGWLFECCHICFQCHLCMMTGKRLFVSYVLVIHTQVRYVWISCVFTHRKEMLPYFHTAGIHCQTCIHVSENPYVFKLFHILHFHVRKHVMVCLMRSTQQQKVRIGRFLLSVFLTV